MEPGARPEDPEGHAFDAAFTFLVVRLEEGARSLLGSFSVGADAGAPEYAVADYLRASGNEDAGRRLSVPPPSFRRGRRCSALPGSG